jgi:alpha-glucosidase (family GH31 glycosyl hydrolase)
MQLWWNWELDEDHYPGWDQLREQLERDDVRLMTYIGPWLANDV